MKIAFILLSFCLLFTFCEQLDPTKEERLYISSLNNKYSPRYRFSCTFDCRDLKVVVNDTINEKLFQSIYTEFKNHSPKISWFCIAVYDSNDIFLFDYFKDIKSGKFIKSKIRHTS